jgi:hypothetical protein
VAQALCRSERHVPSSSSDLTAQVRVYILLQRSTCVVWLAWCCTAGQVRLCACSGAVCNNRRVWVLVGNCCRRAKTRMQATTRRCGQHCDQHTSAPPPAKKATSASHVQRAVQHKSQHRHAVSTASARDKAVSSLLQHGLRARTCTRQWPTQHHQAARNLPPKLYPRIALLDYMQTDAKDCCRTSAATAVRQEAVWRSLARWWLPGCCQQGGSVRGLWGLTSTVGAGAAGCRAVGGKGVLLDLFSRWHLTVAASQGCDLSSSCTHAVAAKRECQPVQQWLSKPRVRWTKPPTYLQGMMICCVCAASFMSAGVRT